MVSKNVIWKKNIYEVVNSNHPKSSTIDEFYDAVKQNVPLDEHDLTPPILRGKYVSGDLNWKRNIRNALQDEKDGLRLINIAIGTWSLPRELSEYEKIDEHKSWDIFYKNAKKYYSENKIFYSWIKKQKYSINSIARDSIEIERLDSNKSQKITSGQIKRAIQRLNAAGGSTGRRTLNYTVAIETALVELHPDLSWSKEGDFIHSRKKDSSPIMGFELDGNVNEMAEIFNPSSIETARKAVARSIMMRQGQPQFRSDLMDAYSGRCAITGTDAIQALEAAHIMPYAEGGINHVKNGMILRSDVHSLFDRGLLGVEPDDYSVIMSDVLTNTSYCDYESLRIRLPKEKVKRPSPKALWNHLETHDLLRFN